MVFLNAETKSMINNLKNKTIFILIAFFMLFFNILCIGAADAALDDVSGVKNQAEAFRDQAGYEDIAGEQGVAQIISLVIKAFLSLLGIIFVILIILGGYNWMTAAGDEQKVEKAKDTLKRAIIGLIIVVSAYAITYFVFNNLPGGDSGPTAY